MEYCQMMDRYPSEYTDPDISDAEHLTRAAYHLIEAGYGDAAMAFVAQVCRAFQDVPVSTKRKEAMKALGQVKYLPCGIIKIDAGYESIAIPAPPYEIKDKDQESAQARNAMTRRGSEACRNAGFGWFSQKQAMGTLSGRIPNTASFRPAVILSRIESLCSAWSLDMPADAAIVLATKLQAILDKNPLSTENSTALRRDLATRGNGMSHYYYCTRDNLDMMGFAYLTEQQSRTAAHLIEMDGPSVVADLSELSENMIKWQECDRDAMSEMRGMLHKSDEQAEAQAPFLKRKRERESERYYYQTQEYNMSRVLDSAVQALEDVNNLMRCHAALCRHDDPYLHQLLLDTKMVDDGLDARIPHDLWETAASLITMLAYKPQEGQQEPVDQDLAEMAAAALPAMKSMAGIPGKLGSDLLCPSQEPCDADTAEREDDAD